MPAGGRHRSTNGSGSRYRASRGARRSAQNQRSARFEHAGGLPLDEVAGAREPERADALGERDRAAVGEAARHDVVGGAVEHERRGRVHLEQARDVARRPLAGRALVDAPARAQLAGVGVGLGHERDLVGRERARRGPEAVAVHVGDVRAAACRACRARRAGRRRPRPGGRSSRRSGVRGGDRRAGCRRRRRAGRATAAAC